MKHMAGGACSVVRILTRSISTKLVHRHASDAESLEFIRKGFAILAGIIDKRLIDFFYPPAIVIESDTNCMPLTRQIDSIKRFLPIVIESDVLIGFEI